MTGDEMMKRTGGAELGSNTTYQRSRWATLDHHNMVQVNRDDYQGRTPKDFPPNLIVFLPMNPAKFNSVSSVKLLQ